MDENLVHELVNHRRGQYREVGVLLRQRKKLIHPGCVRLESIQLIMAAANEALRQVEEANSELMGKMAGGLGGLGGGLPF